MLIFSRRWVLLSVLTWLMLGSFGQMPAVEPAAMTVKLVVDYGDGAQKSVEGIPWKEGMTGFDLMIAAKQHPHGIQFEHVGSGSTVKVTKIDDCANQGGAGNGKNWLFSVNQKRAQVSVGIAPLQAGDVLTWKFDILRPE